MKVDPSVIPGLLFLLAELVALAAVGYVIVRVALRETDHRVALAQGLVVGPAIWGVVVNFVMYALPGIAGVIAGWISVLALAAVLVWRAPTPVRLQLRTAGVFAVVALALFWAALASRQTMGIIDPHVHLGLAASIREGLFPPQLPHSPGAPAPYHYGFYLLNGLLSPPFGPNLAFNEELLGAYAWVSLFLVVTTVILRRASRFALLITAPILLTAGVWTSTSWLSGILEVPVPIGVPAAGIRASLMEIWWPSVELPYASRFFALSNIWKPTFPLSYALAYIVLAHAASARRRSWLSVITLAALVGFLGLMSISLTPIVFLLWASLEAIHARDIRRTGNSVRIPLIRSASGLLLAATLVLTVWFSTTVLGGSERSALSLGGSEYVEGWPMFGALDRLPGGVGILELGPLAIIGAALLLARRDRLVLALAAGAGLLLLTTLVLAYEPRPYDQVRLERHARNFALFALLIALGVRLAAQRSMRWRYAISSALVGLIVWPTIIAPVRNLGLAVASGIDLANARRMATASPAAFHSRFVLDFSPSDRVTTYIRDNTPVDTRVFSTHPGQMTYATGRPNASGFAGLVHFLRIRGPAYLDVHDYLEPAAVRRLGFEYIHASDSWVENLPDDAAEQLNDPRLFELLIRDESERLYRVLPAFLSLDGSPAPASYEALRQAVPAATRVFLPEIFKSREVTRTAQALSHTRLLGVIDGESIDLQTAWRAEPLGDHEPDLIIMPTSFVPWVLSPIARQPIWWSDETAVYALNGAVAPIMPPPPWAEPIGLGVQVPDVHTTDGRAVFTATFDNHADGRWSGQDWVVIAIDESPLGLPKKLLPDRHTPATDLWFSGQIGLDSRTTSLTYEFDFLAPGLAFRHGAGAWTPAQASDAELGPGTYTLAVRLRHEYKPNQWRTVSYIPVLRITVSETGQLSYQVHEEARGAKTDN